MPLLSPKDKGFSSALPSPDSSSSHKVPIPNICGPRPLKRTQSSNSPATSRPQLLASPTPAAIPKASILTISLLSLSPPRPQLPRLPQTPLHSPTLHHRLAISQLPFLPPGSTHTSPLSNSPTKSLYHPIPPPGPPSPTFAHSPNFPITPSPCYVLSIQRALPACIPAIHICHAADRPDIPMEADHKLPPPDETPQLPFPACFFSKRVSLEEIPIHKDFTEILGV